MTARFVVHPSPVGDILIVVVDDRIVSLHPFDAPVGVEVERIGRALGLPIEPGDPEAATLAAAQLDEYFDGSRRVFDLPLDWRLTRGFTTEALHAVSDIPYGEVAGYGEVARSTSSPRAARAVGTACATTPFSIIVPVHRVVRADGSLGEYGGRPDVKRFLIDLEQSVVAGDAPERAASE